ncbi:hypothetical protein [Methylobacterium sp. Leaf89]|uniref:hypothetical protein n=1 Tax=Methylobacterium sp. Leaf89 TaxID=1736245 RepID=UPI0006FEBAF0|nr:hypothetical protein [Methylobacterium sp. Leaf89]KQO68810.1 hypothetical protein ASF18_22000 [Methylobacterium sp. Leaf89]
MPPLEWLDIVAAVEAVLGFPLAFPAIGAPFGVALQGSAFPEQSFMHAYAAWRVDTLGPFRRLAEIAEPVLAPGRLRREILPLRHD